MDKMEVGEIRRLDNGMYIEKTGSRKATLEEVSQLAVLMQQQIARIKAENRQLRADLIRAVSECNRFENAYIEMYRKYQELKNKS